MNELSLDPGIERSLAVGRFYVKRGTLRCEHRAGEWLAWEIFRGHLLDESKTRAEREFETWHLLVESTTGEVSPVLSLLWDAETGAIHVTRSIHTFVEEAYVPQGNVVLTREVRKWVRELVATIELPESRTAAGFEHELRQVLLVSMTGNRLPITSTDSPLPAFSLGEIGYLPHAAAGDAPLTTPADLIERGLMPDTPPLERARVIEMILRTVSAEELPAVAEHLFTRWHGLGWTPADFSESLKTLFNQAALTPYTQFVDRLASLLRELARADRLGVSETVDVIGAMLRQLMRHLTAFDLSTFHNRGANYPDALLLDVLLRLFLEMIAAQPELMVSAAGDPPDVHPVKRLRRRALRQAWLARSECEGKPVPDLPTSPGENRWVLPAPFTRLSAIQLADPGKRRRSLFDGQPTAALFAGENARLLDASIADIEQPLELRELGMAVFLDRPLGQFKLPGEADRTPLLSYEAFSLRIARSRLARLQQAGLIASPFAWDQLSESLESTAAGALCQGLPASQFTAAARPGVAALEDASRAAPDFRFLRTTRSSLRDFLAAFDLAPLTARFPELAAWLLAGRDVLAIRSVREKPLGAGAGIESVLTVFDRRLQPQMEFGIEGPYNPYIQTAGIELPATGLCILKIGSAVAQASHFPGPNQSPIWLNRVYN